jgi:hypothetical protein
VVHRAPAPTQQPWTHWHSIHVSLTLLIVFQTYHVDARNMHHVEYRRDDVKKKKGRKRMRIALSTRGTVWFKDKSKYNRKKKHKGE